MSHHPTLHASTAALGMCCLSAAWLDSGIAPGLVVVDSNRPPIQPVRHTGFARRLLKQFGAAH